MPKPFEPRWAVLVKIGTKWWCHERHRFWFKHEAEEHAARRMRDALLQRYIIVESDTVQATLMLLNG